MVHHGASPTVLVALLAAGVFLVRTTALMLGPLLVAMAAAFHTSVPIMGQLAAAINISWGITAPVVGPVSDTYGRRVVGLSGLLLMALGMLGSILAWTYGTLLACRLLTGVGAAMIPPNSMATIADHFPPEKRGTPISVVLCASFLGTVLVVPLIALLVDLGGWRLPFWVMGSMIESSGGCSGPGGHGDHARRDRRWPSSRGLRLWAAARGSGTCWARMLAIRWPPLGCSPTSPPSSSRPMG